MKIELRVNEVTLPARLNNSAAGRAFYAQLPLTLELKDFAGEEKISDLPARLPTSGSPGFHHARAGDIAYYAPWGNLAIFYRDHGRADKLVSLGRIEGSFTPLLSARPVTVTIQAADQDVKKQ